MEKLRELLGDGCVHFEMLINWYILGSEFWEMKAVMV